MPISAGVFAPVAFLSDLVGQFFKQFGLTVVCATLFSLFVSFTLTPALASRLLGRKRGQVDSAAAAKAQELSSHGAAASPIEAQNRLVARYAAHRATAAAKLNRQRASLKDDFYTLSPRN